MTCSRYHSRPPNKRPDRQPRHIIGDTIAPLCAADGFALPPSKAHRATCPACIVLHARRVP